MPIIDFHAHIYPNKIAQKATNATADFTAYRLHVSAQATSC